MINRDPALSSELNFELYNQDYLNTIVYPNIKQQLYNLEGLNTSYYTKTIEFDFMKNMLTHMHNTFIPIRQFDELLNMTMLTRTAFRILYKFYVIDFWFDIKNELDINDIFYNDVKFKIDMIEILKNRLKMLKELNQEDTLNKHVEYLFYIDLIDNDLTNFKENYVKMLLLK